MPAPEWVEGETGPCGPLQQPLCRLQWWLLYPTSSLDPDIASGWNSRRSSSWKLTRSDGAIDDRIAHPSYPADRVYPRSAQCSFAVVSRPSGQVHELSSVASTLLSLTHTKRLEWRLSGFYGSRIGAGGPGNPRTHPSNGRPSGGYGRTVRASQSSRTRYRFGSLARSSFCGGDLARRSPVLRVRSP